MKLRIKYIALFLASVISFGSCSLDETSFTEVEKNKFINNASEAETVLLGAYRDMTSDPMYGYHLSLYFTLPTDMAKVEGSSIANFRNVPNNSYTSTEDEVQNTWKSLYSAIYDVNDFLERVSGKYDGFSEHDKKLVTVYMGEARALRALYYFELLRWYGHIVLMKDTEESNLHPSKFVQSDPETVYKFIEEDLKYAISVLPYASDDNIRSNNSFRMSKGSALGLLTKVYATWAGYPVHDTSKWNDALQTARTLIYSGKHGLLPDFEQLWKNSANSIWNPTESLIEVSFFSPTITGNSSNDASGRIGKWNGVTAGTGAIKAVRMAANWRVVPTFAQSWENYKNDKRWAVSIADYSYVSGVGKRKLLKYTENGETKYGGLELAMPDDVPANYRQAFNDKLCPGKWDIEKYVEPDNQLMDANMSNVNWYILRYADVLLLYAEALNEVNNGPTDEAINAVNMVRRRGFGLPLNETSSADVSASLDYDGFKSALMRERAYELAFEGHRRQDLIRWGIYAETIKNTYIGLAGWHEQAPDYYSCAQFTLKNKNELLPIPQRDMDLMPQLVQNQGWK